MSAKNKLLNWLAQNDLRKTLSGLNLLANRYKNEQLLNNTSFQSGRLMALEKKRIMDTISSEDDHLQDAKIRQALLHIINELPNDWTIEEIESNTFSFVSISKRNWKKYVFYIAGVVTLLIGIPKLSKLYYDNKKESIEQFTSSPHSILNKVSTSGSNSPAIITRDGDVTANYGETKPQKDSINNQ